MQIDWTEEDIRRIWATWRRNLSAPVEEALRKVMSEAVSLFRVRTRNQEDRALFLLLFYRERITRLAGRLQLQEDVKRKMREKHRRHATKGYGLRIDEIAAFLIEVVQRAEDETRCNDICKSMYFCDRKKGHKGKHRESVGNGGLYW